MRTATAETPTPQTRISLSANFVGILLLISCFYNAGLAMINAHVFSMTPAIVILTEIIIAFMGTCLVIRHFPVLPKMWPAYLLLIVATISIPIVTIYNGDLYLKSIRDVYLISLFFLLGSYLDINSLKKYFRILTACVLAFMIIEMYATQFYVLLFEPALYFNNTRGVEEFELDSSGLFRNALGYEGRFSFGIFETHRLSSLFIEQVSLANFSIVLALFICTFWKNLSHADRALHVLTVLMIILTTSSRTASTVISLIAIGYFIFPLLPKYINILYMPLILAACALFFYDPTGAFTDDLPGRIGHTLNKLAEMDAGVIFGGYLDGVAKTGDSGYAYVFYTQTILGFLALWLFVSLSVPQNDAPGKRFSNGLSLYIFVNLLIGAAIFSIKVSAPLWIMAGFLYHQAKQKISEEHA